MEKYIDPKIKVVTLDPEQSILQVCIIAGGYFSRTTRCIYRVGGGPYRCPSAIRGSTFPADSMSQRAETQPS